MIVKKKLIPYMSYWTSGYKGEPDEFIINLHKLCAHFLIKNFGEVHLITDSKGSEMFKDIPWSSTSTKLDEVDVNYSSVWSISKLYSYKLISELGNPFIHVDFDVLLPEGLNPRLMKSKLIAQMPERTAYYYYNIDKLENNCPKLYDIENFKVTDGYNVGILGGSDIEFFYRYATAALNFVTDPENRNFWLNYSASTYWMKSVIAEQYYLAVMAKKYNKKFDFIFPNGWPTEKLANEKKFIHLMGAKTNQGVPEKINRLVSKLKL